ncbi:ABC transporter ATP-binding protein [Eleftheria terrae]|uniref:ABC transporter ATP-binding protein n=1 Tax=Eleftheria terrae TaxID=1597781 RepID=UPI00263A850C|nr:ABC transporter ATP-binding protein [Eleftheria terrae]WKB52622.1 ABC transporter ATP-binding protein [Eleftheria terrae]
MRVTCENIRQSYAGQALFADLNLCIPAGAFFTLLGPSGCGKTTLLRMLAGFVRPDQGRILFGEQDVTSVPVHRRGVGMVFQDYALFPDRSVLENVRYGLSARQVPRAESTARATAMLRRVGLEAVAQRSPASLSGGQRQRVAMARALVIEPRLLLLDEPLSALDAKLRVELRSMVRELQAEAGITTVFVTHDQEEALALSDIVAVMDRGRIVQLGTPREVYRTPRTPFVADFVGRANLLPIIEELPADANGRRRFKTSGGVLLSGNASACSPPASFAVRSEDIVLTDARPAAEGELAGIVERAEFRGGITAYTVGTPAGTLQVDVLSQQQQRLRQPGEPVLLRLPTDAHMVERD